MCVGGGVCNQITVQEVSFLPISTLRAMTVKSSIRVLRIGYKIDKHTGKYLKGNLFQGLLPKGLVLYSLNVR